MSYRVHTLEYDVTRLLAKGQINGKVRKATSEEVEKLSDVWECTHAVFLDDCVALGVLVVDGPAQDNELWWYVYTYVDEMWTSHNDTGEDRTFVEALSDAVSMLFWHRTNQLTHGIIE